MQHRGVVDEPILDIVKQRAVTLADQPQTMRQQTMGVDAGLDAVGDQADVNRQRDERDHRCGDLIFAGGTHQTEDDRRRRQREQREGRDLGLERRRGQPLGRARVRGVVLNDEPEIEAQVLDDAQ